MPDCFRLWVPMILMVMLLACPREGLSQTPAAGSAAPDDTPSVRVGATLFLDYTVTQEPRTIDADGNRITPNSFNVARSYINVTGQISHLVAFRVTPDIARESGAGSSLNGSYTFRLKYAYAQFNLSDWVGGGSWLRLGMQQTPWVDFIDNVYRYRFQGTTLEDREGILASSDVGATFRCQFSGNYGEVHGGLYNGDNYNRAEANDQKALMVRVTIRPLPQYPRLSGLRITGFYDLDAYVKDAERRRGIVGATYEHPYVNAGVNYVATTDQTRIVNPKLNGHGYSIWTTPKTPKGFGWEGLLRFDHLVQEQATSVLTGTRDRTIAGVAYWFPRQGNVSAALLLDYEWVNNRNYNPSRDDERRLALHALINF
ncbi:MAG: hypothetical protein WBC51_17775 [Vicinamibacterales bacterium]